MKCLRRTFAKKRLKRCERFLAERGAIDGLHEISEDVEPYLQSELRTIGRLWFGEVQSGDSLDEQMAMLQALRQEAQEACTTATAESRSNRVTPRSFDWHWALSAVTIVGIVGMGLTLWLGPLLPGSWGLLACVAILMSINQSAVDALGNAVRVRAAESAVKRLTDRLAKARSQRIAAIRHEDDLNTWLSEQERRLMCLYSIHREEGRKAAHQLSRPLASGAFCQYSDDREEKSTRQEQSFGSSNGNSTEFAGAYQGEREAS